MNNRPSMFLSSVSVVDIGIFHPVLGIQGFSLNPSFIVSADCLDPNEGVVVDFSAIKKEIKSFLDATYDHKLFVSANPRPSSYSVDTVFSTTTITSKAGVKIVVPSDAVYGMYSTLRPVNDKEVLESFSTVMSHDLTRHVQSRYPFMPGLSVTCVLSQARTSLYTEGLYTPLGLNFTLQYAHGLKRSTSYGCQNIGHGHLSYIQFLDEELTQNDKDNNLRPIIYNADADSLTNLTLEANYFVNRDDVDITTSHIMVGYTSLSRGNMEYTYPKDSIQGRNTYLIQGDTTIENIAPWILTSKVGAARIKLLLNSGIRYMLASEGPTKGAIVDLKDFA